MSCQHNQQICDLHLINLPTGRGEFEEIYEATLQRIQALDNNAGCLFCEETLNDSFYYLLQEHYDSGSFYSQQEADYCIGNAGFLPDNPDENYYFDDDLDDVFESFIN